MKLEKGDNVFRVLSDAIVGWEGWKDSKPVRWPNESKPHQDIIMALDMDENANPPRPKFKHFWAFIVWNYKQEQVQILEITQKRVMSDIENLIIDEDWGDPKEYDIKITREGDGFETKYKVSPKPKKAVSQEIVDAYEASSVKVETLFDGGNPFEANGPSPLDDPENIPFD